MAAGADGLRKELERQKEGEQETGADGEKSSKDCKNITKSLLV